MHGPIVDWLANNDLDWAIWLVPTPGMLYGVAIGVSVVLFLRRGRLTDLDRESLVKAAVVATAGGLVGARLYYLMISGGILDLNLQEYLSLEYGTGSWGAYVGAGIAFLAYSFVSNLPRLAILDLAASCAPLATGIGRLSCFLAGDDFGKVTSVGWGISYPPDSPAFNAHVLAGWIKPTSETSLAVHPNQLYLFANAIIIFVVVSAVWRHNMSRPGYTFAAYMLLYGTTRFAFEFFRAAQAGGMAGSLSSSQWMSLSFVLIGLPLLLNTRRDHRFEVS